MSNLANWLVEQRENAGLTRTQVAERMGFPGGAIKAIEEGRRIPRASTIYKYMNAVTQKQVSPDMYSRFHNREVA